MSLHKEIAFEDGICAHLAAQDWLYEADAATRYDRARALYPEDLIAWVREAQPDAWAALEKSHGVAAGTMLADRLRAALDKQGTLELLRAGLDVVGLRQRVALCQFRPALAMNKELQARYAANRLRVVRQVRYSLHNENCLDLVLFLNGIPVATAELKSDYTQSVQDAIDQYCYDRQPKPAGRNTAEPTANSCRSTKAAILVPATRPTRTAPQPPIYGNKSGNAIAGWKSSAAIWCR